MKKIIITLTIMLVSILVMAQTNGKNYVKNTTYQQPVQNEAEIQALPTLEMFENITYYDGLGRAEQSIALRSGGTSNLYVNELPNEWQEGLHTTPYYMRFGTEAENIIVNGTTPFGYTDLLWKSTNQDTTDATNTSVREDGGWTGASISVDKTRTYYYSTWVKKTGNLTCGNTYLGPQNVSNLSGTPQSNPYFWTGTLPELNTWYQIRGVVHPYNYAGGDTGESGVYDINGNKVLDGAEFKWNANTTTSRFRNYLYNCTDVNTSQYWYRPHLTHSESQTVIEDIITPVVYDADGRQTKEYLPYADVTAGNFTRENIAITKINNYYADAYSDDFNGTLNPYSEKNLEASPLARILEQGAPGTDWMIDATVDTDHTIKFEYETNATDEVAYYTVTFTEGNTESPELQYSGNYVEEQLYKNVIKDENWNPNQMHLKDHTTEEFKNKSEQVLLKRTYNLGEAHDTYYIYDDFGNLTYVLSPKGADAIKNANYTIAQNVLDELCYQYKYDGRNRLVEKKIPGKGWEYIIYDKLNRPVLTQDANQRNQSPKQWLFSKYDAFDRVVYTGVYTNNANRLSMQDTFDSQNILNESRTLNNTNIGDASAHYSNVAFPIANTKLLTVSYYDDYPKEISNLIPNPGNFTLAGNVHTISDFTRTLATASKVRLIDTNHWIVSATYYDDKKRPIYVESHNDYLHTKDVVKTALDFIGKTIETESSHAKKNHATIKINDVFTYDHAARLLTQTQSINNGTPELIVNNTYDALGELVNKKVGGDVAAQVEGSTGLQSVDYRYNVRGWLKQINDVENLGNDLFSFELSYNTTKTNTSPLYNGNISETHSRTANDDEDTRRGYGYTYDALNRLKGAKGIVKLFGTLFASHIHYNEDGIQYDKNGNILRLNRKQNSVDLIDRLFYNYDIGNKLLSVDDNTSGANASLGFNDGNTTGNDYVYDANGNMTVDKNKGITNITYNHLNLPTQVVFNDNSNKSIHYLYDATGEKQAKVVGDNGNYTTTYYANNFIYERNNAGEELKFFNHPEGYVQPNATGRFDYVYQYKDHLGNIRLSYSDTNNDNQVLGQTTQVFMDDMENSSGWNSQGALHGSSATITTSRSKSGTSSLMIDKQTPGSKYGSANTWIQIDNDQATEYTYSGWVYAETNTVNSHAVPEIFIMMRVAGETNYTTSYSKIRTYTKNQWVYLEETISVPANIVELFLAVKNLNGNGITWFDDIKVVRTNPVEAVEIVEENNYYPFGLKHKGYNNIVSSNSNSIASKFKYNGIELEEALGLDLYEMEFRQYDPSIARFTSNDPVTHYDLSTYSAFDNSPVYWADPSGADAESLIEDIWNKSGSGKTTWTNNNNGTFSGSNGATAEDEDYEENNIDPEKAKKIRMEANSLGRSNSLHYTYELLNDKKNTHKITISAWRGNVRRSIEIIISANEGNPKILSTMLLSQEYGQYRCNRGRCPHYGEKFYGVINTFEKVENYSSLLVDYFSKPLLDALNKNPEKNPFNGSVLTNGAVDTINVTTGAADRFSGGKIKPVERVLGKSGAKRYYAIVAGIALGNLYRNNMDHSGRKVKFFITD